MAGEQSDLVRDSKLECTISSNSTVHVKHVSDPATGLRRVRTEELWQRTKQLGQGGFGIVWLEKCTSGPNNGKARAVKCIAKVLAEPSRASSVVDYNRELEAIAKFSQERVRDPFSHLRPRRVNFMCQTDMRMVVPGPLRSCLRLV